MLLGQGTAETHCQGHEISGNEVKGGIWGRNQLPDCCGQFVSCF